MRPIKLSNKAISTVLNSIQSTIYSEEFLDPTKSKVKRHSSGLITEYEPYSDEYFYKAFNEFNLKEFAFPRDDYMGSIKHIEPVNTALKKFGNKLQRRLCAQGNALFAIYPPGGYIGWHHNGNAPGYNILFSYSQDGKGWFKYYDYADKEIKTIYDEPGWNVKVGYYPNQEAEPERVYWHSAYTENTRVSIAFIVNDRDLWLSMIDDISDGNYDESLKSQGPLK